MENIVKSHSHAITLSRRAHELDTVGANVSLKSIPSCHLKPRSTNLDFALTSHPCSPVFHVYTYYAFITFATGRYTGGGVNIPACNRIPNSSLVEF